MPCCLHALYSSTEPFITPWSVSPRAGWSKAAARSASASILHAPSSSEYSEWTWRWAQEEVLTGRPNARRPGGGGSAPAGGLASASPLFAPIANPREERLAVLVPGPALRGHRGRRGGRLGRRGRGQRKRDLVRRRGLLG